MRQWIVVASVMALTACGGMETDSTEAGTDDTGVSTSEQELIKPIVPSWVIFEKWCQSHKSEAICPDVCVWVDTTPPAPPVENPEPGTPAEEVSETEEAPTGYCSSPALI